MIDGLTGEIIPVQIFVAVMGASSQWRRTECLLFAAQAVIAMVVTGG